MKKQAFSPSLEWKSLIPEPVCSEHPEYLSLYWKAWELAHDHIKEIPGMPQNPYMDEAFCDTDIWIWDTCFMSLFCKYAQTRFPGVESLNNFYSVLYECGTLPEIISHNAPSWTGVAEGEKARVRIHIYDNPPLFAWAEYQNALFRGDRESIVDLLLNRQVLQKHFESLELLTERRNIPGVRSETCWIKHENGYFWEGGRSGMDNTPRGRIGEHAGNERPNNPDMLWLDAIVQQGLAAQCIAKLAGLIGETELEQTWKAKYERIREIVNRLYWDSTDECYYDISASDSSYMKVLTPASFWPLTAGMSSQEQAERISRFLMDPKTLGGEVPLLSLSRSDPDFEPEYGLYWRGALWVPTAYAAIKGIEQYGLHDLARSVSSRILTHLSKTFEQFEPHTIWECYAPGRPEPAHTCGLVQKMVRRDFCGWSALAPIGLFIENVIGIHSVNAFTNTVEWALPETVHGELGVRNFRFGDVVADLICSDGKISAKSNLPFHLLVNGRKVNVEIVPE